MKKCVNCGFELEDKAQFCIECGTKQPQQAKCTECGADLQPGAKFCTQCGAKQVAKKIFCSNCGTELQEGMKFCVECGTPAQESSISTSPKKQSDVENQPEEVRKETSVISISEDNEPQKHIVDINCNYKAVEDDDEELFGFQDEDGNWVIEPQFEDALDFRKGLAAVCENGEWGFIKTDGTYLIEPQFDEVFDFENGPACVKIDGQWGFLNLDGSYLVEPQFDDAEEFNDGFAAVEEDGEWGFIKPDGTFLFEPQFDKVENFRGKSAKAKKNGKWGIVTATGESFYDCDAVKVSGYGFAAFRKNDKWGFLKPDCSILIEPKFQKIEDFSNGFAIVQLDDKYGYLKSDGSYLVKPKFEDAYSFYEDLAAVKLNGKYGFINNEGELVIDHRFDEVSSFSEGYACVKVDEKWGFITKSGAYFVKPIFDSVDEFYQGKARGTIGKWPDYKDGTIYTDGTYIIDRETKHVSDLYGNMLKPKKSQNGKYGFVDIDNDWIIPAKYDEADEFKEGFAHVRIGNKHGFIKQDGSYLIEPKFEDASSFSKGFARIMENGLHGFIKTDGTYLAKPIFKGANSFDGRTALVEIDGLNYNCYLYSDGELLAGGSKGPLETFDMDKKLFNFELKKIESEKKQRKEENKSTNSHSGSSSSKRKSTGLTPFEDTDGKWGYLNENGDIALLAMYDYAEKFDGDYARVIVGGNEMFIDKNGDLCHDRKGSLYNPDDYESEEDYENDDDMSYLTNPAPKKKSFLKQVAKAAWDGFVNSGNGKSSSSSSSFSAPKKEIRKTWTCHYIGKHPQAPAMIQVPSANSTGRPSGNEIVEALKNMGYNDSLARSIANGGSNLEWECK